ncbi:AAA family ATPase [Apibacter sp. ESL0404]|uniref:AAA family ATPase n=1 Tax=Apibacter sp. ESL0404 TaxID=2704651 RepID=UPI001C69A146|nr:AAA family ATPase [Apibacter sp. ESL0404]QYN51609.1 AAA family ATPase [Apibacter sp. ESL0404]
MISKIHIPKGTLPYIFGSDHEALTLNLVNEAMDTDLNYIENKNSSGSKRESKYISNFWGENIQSVSAIVGNNGAGKSTLLKAIRDGNCQFIGTDGEEIPHNSKLIFYYNSILGYDDTPNFRSKTKNVLTLSKFSILKKDREYADPEFSMFLKIHNNAMLERILNLIKNKKVYTKLLELGLPTINNIKIKINHSNKDYYNIPDTFKPFFQYFKDDRERKQKEREKILERKDYSNNEDKENLKVKIIKAIIKRIHLIFEETGNIYIREGFIRGGKTVEYLKTKKIYGLKDAFFWYLDNAYIKVNNIEFQLPVQEIKKLIDILLSTIEKSNKFDFLSDYRGYLNYDFIANNLDTLEIIDAYQDFTKEFKKHFKVTDEPLFNFSTDRELSSGEKLMYEQFSIFNEQVSRIENALDVENNTDEYLILLDEADVCFHPLWKKKYINMLLEVLPLIFVNKKLQIIFTTHDPLTLSDIPHQNILFLGKGKKYTKVLTNKRKTFGANISNLLADSFFLEDGLVGDFAKKKIEEVIHVLNKMIENKNNNQHIDISDEEQLRIRNLISMVDEHIIQSKLIKMYNEAFGPSIDNEIQELEERLNYLKNLKNKTHD